MKTAAEHCEESKRQKLQRSDLFGTWHHTDTSHQNTLVTYANIFFPIIILPSTCPLLPLTAYGKSESKKEADYL